VKQTLPPSAKGRNDGKLRPLKVRKQDQPKVR
jgi:hypothetical protein